MLARSGTPLVRLPQVRSAFGSMWRCLEDRGAGWQLLDLGQPLPHQWPTVGAGPAELARSTGAPVLAAFVSDTSCVQVAGARPDGRSFSSHVVDDEEGRCGYDHHRLHPLRGAGDAEPAAPDLPALTAELVGWARAAGLDPSARRIRATLVDSPYPDLTYDLADAFGLPPGDEAVPLFDHQEPEWRGAWRRAHQAGLRVCRRWTSAPYDDDAAEDAPLPGDAEFLHFVEQVADSMYGDGLTRRELAEEAARLLRAWP